MGLRLFLKILNLQQKNKNKPKHDMSYITPKTEFTVRVTREKKKKVQITLERTTIRPIIADFLSAKA